MRLHPSSYRRPAHLVGTIATHLGLHSKGIRWTSWQPCRAQIGIIPARLQPCSHGTFRAASAWKQAQITLPPSHTLESASYRAQSCWHSLPGWQGPGGLERLLYIIGGKYDRSRVWVRLPALLLTACPEINLCRACHRDQQSCHIMLFLCSNTVPTVTL